MSSKKSLRRRSEELGLSRASLQRILKKDLKLYPYGIQIKHKLIPADIEKRLSYKSLSYFETEVNKLAVNLLPN